ncbi:MAG: PH domain-containing protein [Armatimonadetes bacterium]|nr:PH domain-containing protein [Armatimonadota bacterium]
MDDASTPTPAPPAARRTTGGPRGIHPAIKKVWVVSGLFGSLLSGAMFIVPGYLVFDLQRDRNISKPIAVAVFTVFALIWLGTIAFTLAKIRRQWESWQYEVREHDVVLSWGVFWKTRRHVARDRIQHLDINSGPLDRRFGLVQVGIHTAGGAGTVGVIPGLTPEEAEDLRDMILESQADHV